ncbi:MAG: hypothetical protein U0V48_04945 [Anaerolineales bacterium]
MFDELGFWVKSLRYFIWRNWSGAALASVRGRLPAAHLLEGDKRFCKLPFINTKICSSQLSHHFCLFIDIIPRCIDFSKVK